jgi:hypothetical protein
MLKSRQPGIDIYFSDFFDIAPSVLETYGAFNISLINDLPLFIDPFLLFNSRKSEYQDLHGEMIRYVRFLRDKAATGPLDKGLIDAWFTFREVKQNWLGFSKNGNSGSGLGTDFAKALHRNLNSVFKTFGSETATKASHLEKLTLIQGGVGRDNISDFVTTLIKCFLLEYTQTFARTHLSAGMRGIFTVNKVFFNYATEVWESAAFELPAHRCDFVILTPKDILTKDVSWISRPDMLKRFDHIAESLSDASLRALVNNYLARQIPKNPTPSEVMAAKARTIEKYPQIIEHYIKGREDTGDQAELASKKKVRQTEEFYIEQVKALVLALRMYSGFYSSQGLTYADARQRVVFLKDVIENKDGYRIFWREGQPIRKEEDLQILYRLTWFGAHSDINREVNNGRGPVDFAASRGSADKTLVEFKLASNSKLEQNLQKQVEIYKKASSAQRALKVIVYFNDSELQKVDMILKRLGLISDGDITLIDARSDNKPSASIA